MTDYGESYIVRWKSMQRSNKVSKYLYADSWLHYRLDSISDVWVEEEELEALDDLAR